MSRERVGNESGISRERVGNESGMSRELVGNESVMSRGKKYKSKKRKEFRVT